MLGPLAIENAASRSVAPARTPFDPASDFYRPSGSSVHEGLKGGQVLTSDVTYDKDETFCRGRRASGDLTRMAPATGRRAVSGYKTCLRAAKPPNTEYAPPVQYCIHRSLKRQRITCALAALDAGRRACGGLQRTVGHRAFISPSKVLD